MNNNVADRKSKYIERSNTYSQGNELKFSRNSLQVT